MNKYPCRPVCQTLNCFHILRKISMNSTEATKDLKSSLESHAYYYIIWKEQHVVKRLTCTFRKKKHTCLCSFCITWEPQLFIQIMPFFHVFYLSYKLQFVIFPCSTNWHHVYLNFCFDTTISTWDVVPFLWTFFCYDSYLPFIYKLNGHGI